MAQPISRSKPRAPFTSGVIDQLVPFPNCGAVTAKLPPNAILKVYPGECHGLIATAKQRVNEDILAFIKK